MYETVVDTVIPEFIINANTGRHLTHCLKTIFIYEYYYQVHISSLSSHYLNSIIIRDPCIQLICITLTAH